MNVVEYQDTFFLDTNVLVYAFDRSAPAKQKIAEQVIGYALGTGRGEIGTQVVQEFLNTALRRFLKTMSVMECREVLSDILMPLCRHYPTAATYDRALVIFKETGYAFYDALIVAAAVESGCRTLLTEDLQHGRVVQGVTIVNPFAG